MLNIVFISVFSKTHNGMTYIDKEKTTCKTVMQDESSFSIQMNEWKQKTKRRSEHKISECMHKDVGLYTVNICLQTIAVCTIAKQVIALLNGTEMSKK